jgi:hypothetical protein
MFIYTGVYVFTVYAIFLCLVFYCIFSGVKREGREAGHLPPSASNVKNSWSYTSIFPYAFTTRTTLRFVL